MKTFFKIFTVLIFAITLIACGGGEKAYNEQKFVGKTYDGSFFTPGAKEIANDEGHPARVVNEEGVPVEDLGDTFVEGRLNFTIADNIVVAVAMETSQPRENQPVPTGPSWTVAILGWFAFGTLFWWIISGGFIWFLFWELNQEEENLAFMMAVFAAYGLFLYFISGINFIGLVMNDPAKAAYYVLGYFAMGMVWTIAKWYLYSTRKGEEYAKQRKKFLIRASGAPERDIEKCIEESHGTVEEVRALRTADLDTVVPVCLRKQWASIKIYRPKWREKKQKLSTWVIWWPLSMFWSFFDDFIKRSINAMLEWFGGIFDAISRKAFRRFEEDEVEE